MIHHINKLKNMGRKPKKEWTYVPILPPDPDEVL